MPEQIEATRSPKVPTSGHKESFALLNSCLMDGDVEQRSRERQGRRRALAISVGLQSSALVALLIIPLIGRTERITLGTFTPIPPYKHYRGDTQTPPRPSDGPRAVCQFCYSPIISPTIPTRDPNRTGEVTGPIIGVGPIGAQDNPDGIQIPDSRPTRPLEEVRTEPQTLRIHVGHLEPAMLVRRIEPQYPTLAKQIGRAGRVELHAIIAADGSIQSLEVVDGDPMFVRSALDAVSQWHYKPTLLNGLPVEVDTHITVIYSMQR